ncbi:recombinase family protein [Dehalococcoides mccartyi]|uniref:recombinase family protein n=1 Tax=Dehalococcoides mccartyi TaxID=61435 RepID=UPI0006BDC42F|nr:recombinase family protein [Dehalococcoides mccartyi]BAS31210.1 hypothetical protein IBK_0135 [Dehalococcoides mccartyi IBARAKI]
MKVAIYARVSTPGQELEQQLNACRDFCQYKKFDSIQEYTDVCSGVKYSRPGLDAMLKAARHSKYAGVVVFRLDRLGRRIMDSIMLFDELSRRGIEIYSVHEGIDPSTAAGRLNKNLILAFAEYERDAISEATKQRLAALKASGKILGRKPLSKAKVRKVLELKAEGKTYRQIRDLAGLSLGKISEILVGGKNV